MLQQSRCDFKRDGLGNDESRWKPKKLSTCHIWKDPDLNGTKNRRRSFPNPMKRFLAELRGEKRIFLFPVTSTEERYKLGPKPSETSGKKVRHEYTKSDYVAKAYKDTLKLMSKGACVTDEDPAVLRCEKCDYPLEPYKRRPPPHPFAPVLTFSMESQGKALRSSVQDKPSTAIVSMYGLKDNKVQRIKRRRSSTELYKNMVSA